MIIHCSTIGEPPFPGRQQGMVQPSSCALTSKLSHGCFQASVRTVMRELYCKYGASDGSGESVKIRRKKSHFKGLSALRKAQQKKRRERAAPHLQLSWRLFLSFCSSPCDYEEGGEASTNQGSVVCCSQAHNWQ